MAQGKEGLPKPKAKGQQGIRQAELLKLAVVKVAHTPGVFLPEGVLQM